jgi:Ca-activated chloride channel family protein
MPQNSKRVRPGLESGILSIFILILSSFIAAYPQDTEEPTKQDRRKQIKPILESTAPAESPEEPKGFKIGVSVDLVLMYSTVIDANGKFVSGLKQEDFKVFEDGVRQSINSFAQEDVPISMGILIDLSLSMRKKIDQVNHAALAFIRASNPQDQVFLIGFNENAELLQDFTSDIDEISDSLENAVVMGSTAIYDAIYLGVQKAHTGIKPKKAIVVITDGEDRESFYSLEELLAKIQESDVQVFCVGFLNEIPKKGLFGGFSKSIPEKARDSLQKMSEETGGKAFFPAATADLNKIVAEIATELRSQYAIGYYSTNSARDGTFRRVKIEVAGAVAARQQIRHRRGYFAPKADITQK